MHPTYPIPSTAAQRVSIMCSRSSSGRRKSWYAGSHWPTEPPPRRMGRMARMRTLADRAEQLLGSAVVSTPPVAGGAVCTSTRLRLSDGRSALIKTRPHAPEGLFEAEARGLRWLAEPGVAEVAEVLAVTADCIILPWIEPSRPSPESAAAFGRMLARLHSSGADRFGADEDGFIATLPLPNKPADSWPEFFAVRRILPYLKLAADRGHIDDAGV